MYWTLLTAYGVFALAVISPGPDFAVTVKNSVLRGRTAGRFCAFGIAVANAFHMIVINLGLGAIVRDSPAVFRAIEGVAAAYLFYLGTKAMRARASSPVLPDADLAAKVSQHPFFEGLTVNLLNAKAIVFWLSYFAMVAREPLPLPVRAAFIGLLFLSLFAWFSFVAQVLSNRSIRERFLRHEVAFNRCMGALLILLAIRVAVGVFSA